MSYLGHVRNVGNAIARASALHLASLLCRIFSPPLLYIMIKPMIQKPKRPTMELCICCGVVPPVTSLVGVVVAFRAAVGIRVCESVADILVS